MAGSEGKPLLEAALAVVEEDDVLLPVAIRQNQIWKTVSVQIRDRGADRRSRCDADDDARNRSAAGLTRREFGTLAAFELLSRKELDFAVMEIGLGGRRAGVTLGGRPVPPEGLPGLPPALRRPDRCAPSS